MADPTIYGVLADRILEIRELAGGLGERSATDESVTRRIVRADVWITTYTTGKNWSEDDAQLPLVVNASNYMAAAEVIDSIPNSDSKKSGDLRLQARDFAKGLNRKDGAVQRKSTTVVSAGFNVLDEINEDNYGRPVATPTANDDLL